MGVNVSKSVQKAKQTIQNSASLACTNVADVQQNIRGVKVELSGVNCGDISFVNRSSIAQSCDLGAMSKALAQASMRASSEQLATLGLAANVNTSVEERESEIKTKLEAKCGSTALVRQNIEDNWFKIEPWESRAGKVYMPSCDVVEYLNDSNVTQQCVMKTIMDSIDTSKMESDAKQTVKFPIGITLGIGLGIVAFIIITVVIIMVMKKKKPGTSEGAEGMEGMEGMEGAVGGARRSRKRGTTSNINWRNVPITVLGIMMLVWYAKMTESRR